MSRAQFEKFYWPTLKKSILANVELGYVSAPFWEGIWDDRLEYLLELPKGKVVFFCELTDVYRAKEILGDHMCIQGGVPPTILQTGSPQDVEDLCKKLIKTVGKNGGFILGPGQRDRLRQAGEHQGDGRLRQEVRLVLTPSELLEVKQGYIVRDTGLPPGLIVGRVIWLQRQ